MNTSTLTTLPSHMPMLWLPVQRSIIVVSSSGNSPVCQPPMNNTTAMAEMANILPYSAMKNRLQRRPEYSVWKPATSSLSASARSNGARLQLAVPQVKKTQNAAKVNGSWKMNQFHKNPDCL